MLTMALNSSLAKHKRHHKITFYRHRKHFHSSSILKITLETAQKNFPQQPIMTQNPPCNTLAIVQTSEIDCNQITKEKKSAIFRRKIIVQ